jgi:hypothetical protein
MPHAPTHNLRKQQIVKPLWALCGRTKPKVTKKELIEDHYTMCGFGTSESGLEGHNPLINVVQELFHIDRHVVLCEDCRDPRYIAASVQQEVRQRVVSPRHG